MTVAAVEAAVAVKKKQDDKKAARKQEQAAKEQPAPQPKSGGGRSQLKAGPMSAREQRAVTWAWSGNRKVLTAQFVLCTFILILGTLTSDDKAKSSGARALVKGSALALLFFLLALLSSAGGSSAKAATAMGTLVTAAYALTSSDVHAVVTWVGAFFGEKAKTAGTKDKDEGGPDSTSGNVPGSSGPGTAQTEPGHTVTGPGGQEIVTGTVW